MKLFKYLTAVFFLISSSINLYAQNYDADTLAIGMLKKFYAAYGELKITIKDRRKLDSLQKKYCTNELQKLAKQSFGDGYDIMTHDWGISPEALKSLTVKKDLSKKITMWFLI